MGVRLVYNNVCLYNNHLSGTPLTAQEPVHQPIKLTNES